MKFMITLVSVILFLVCTSLGITTLICCGDWTIRTILTINWYRYMIEDGL